MIFTHSEFVFVALVIQHAMRMRRIILSSVDCLAVDCVWNVMAHAQKPNFVFRRNGPSPFKSAGASVQSTTGSRGVRISGSNAGYTMFRGSVKGTDYSLHSPVSPSRPHPCVTVCHHISTELLTYFATFSYKRHDFRSGGGVQLWKDKGTFSFFLQHFFFCEHLSSLEKVSEILSSCTHVFEWSTVYSCQMLIKLIASRQIFLEYTNIKFHENPSSGSRVVPCGRTDVHDETNSHFSQFCERA
jgi:hypothetical protein